MTVYRRISEVLLAVAILAGLTISSGAIWPTDRFFTLGLLLCSALFALAANPAPSISWPLLCPAVAYFVAMLHARIPTLGTEITIQYFFFALAASVLTGNEKDPAAAFRLPSWGLVIGGVVLAVSVLWEILRQCIVLGPEGLGLGAGGTVQNANVAAIALAAAVPAVMDLHLRDRLHPAFAGILALPVVAAIFLTGSRTGIIALGFGLILPLMNLPRGSRALRMGIVAVLAISALAVLYVGFSAKLGASYITNTQRGAMAAGVIRAAKGEILFGFGPWSFPLHGLKYVDWPQWQLHPHSFPLRTLFEAGLLGLVAWGITLAAAIKPRWKKGTAPAVALALLGGSFTDDVIWLPATGALFFIVLGSCLTQGRIKVPRPLIAIFLTIAGVLAAALPLAHALMPGLPLEPPCFRIDEAARTKTAPDFAGWEQDPSALRVGAYARLAQGDTAGAIGLIELAQAWDPHLLYGPYPLDEAWLKGDTAALEKLRLRAPILTAWYLGETTTATQSMLDRHYGIEFPNVAAIDVAAISDFPDRADWRYHRNLGAQALVRGDTPEARAQFWRSLNLADRQYGTDPLLMRLCALAEPASTADFVHRAARRLGPIVPYSYYMKLIYRQQTRFDGDNTPWWKELWQARSMAPAAAIAEEAGVDTGVLLSDTAAKNPMGDSEPAFRAPHSALPSSSDR